MVTYDNHNEDRNSDDYNDDDDYDDYDDKGLTCKMPLSSLLQRKIVGQPVLAGCSANFPAQFEDERI